MLTWMKARSGARRLSRLLSWLLAAGTIADQGFAVVKRAFSGGLTPAEVGASLLVTVLFVLLALSSGGGNKIAGGIAGALGTIGLLAVAVAPFVLGKLSFGWPSIVYLAVWSVAWLALGLLTLGTREPVES